MSHVYKSRKQVDAVFVYKPGAAHKTWEIRYRAGGSIMGVIQWVSAWRCYCFLPVNGAVLDTDTMNELALFCLSRTHEQKLMRVKAAG